jgi:hypothetical protein
MQANAANSEQFTPSAFHYYRRALETLQTSGVPFLVGGGFALAHYTGIIRYTKDLDLFVRAADVPRTLAVLASAGYRTEMVFSHWLAKAFRSDDFVDIIFCSGNGLCAVDSAWFSHSVEGEVVGTPVRFIPPEEMIWQKAFIMERERFDGADVMHLLHARGRQLDWDRLLGRFGPHWRVLLAHLILFGFVYPGDRDNVPTSVLRPLLNRLSDDAGPCQDIPLCQGTLLSRMQYLTDTEEWGYVDPRRPPSGALTEEQLNRWTDAGR